MRDKITQRSISKAKPGKKPYEIRDTALAGFMVRVQPTGRMSYVVEYARGRRMTIGKANVLTPAQARAKAVEILAQAAQGLDPASEKRKTKVDTLRNFIKVEYRPWVRVHRKCGDIWCDQILRVFASLVDKSLSEITAHHVDKIRTARLEDGVKPSTVNRNVTCLQGALSHAVQAGYLDVNPLSGFKALPVDSAGVVRYLGEDELRRLAAALRSRDDEIRQARDRANEWRKARHRALLKPVPVDGFGDHLTPLVLLSLNTGIRRGEAFGLMWSDVDFNLNQITIRGENSKRNKTRFIPLNAEAQDVLRRWHWQTRGSGLIFPSRDGERLDNVNKAWAGVLKDAEISGFRWHDLRHTFASWLVMRGVDLNTVRELLGHSDIKMTLRYAHLAPQHKADAVARLSW